MLYSLILAVGQVFVYKLILLYKQHIAPLVIASRKLITILVSLFVYNEYTNYLQLIGILILTIILIY